MINRTVYIVGGHKYIEGEEYSAHVNICEYLDLDNVEKGWVMTWGGGQEELPSLLLSTNTTLGPTFATKISDRPRRAMLWPIRATAPSVAVTGSIHGTIFQRMTLSRSPYNGAMLLATLP